MARTTINSQGVPVGTITASDLSYPLTDFSSTGIDDNASSNAITISSSQAVTMSGLTYPTTDGTANQVLTTDGSGALTFANTSSGGVEYVAKTTTYTASANEGIIANTSGGAWTLTLPASPSAGDKVFVADGDDWSTNNLTVARNGSTIEGSAADFTMDYGGVNVGFIYDGSTWQVYPQAGLLQLMGIDDNATSTALTIDSSGNVGIGTTSPAKPLSVQHSSGASAEIEPGHASGVNRFINYDRTASAYYPLLAEASDLRFATGTGTSVSERMRIDSSGNVGIGATSPAHELHIAGTEPNIRLESGGTPSALYGLEITNGSTVDGYFRSRGATGETQIGSGRSSGWGGHLTFYTDTSERMRINSSGNVGIGTVNPTSKLQVEGVVAVSPSGTAGDFLTIASGGYQTTIGGWSNSTDSDIDGLLAGSTFGNILRGAPNGHFVVALQENDNADTFSVVSGGGNYQTDTTYDTLAFTVDARGHGAFSGNLLVGTNSTHTGAEGGQITLYDNNATGGVFNIDVAGAYNRLFTVTSNQNFQIGQLGGTGGRLIFYTAGTRRMDLDESGNVLVGVSSTLSANDEGVQIGQNGMVTTARNQTSDQTHAAFINPNGQVGRIRTLNNATTFVTSSDQRLKENIVDAPAGNIDAIRIRSFDWLSDGAHQTYGVVAQELVNVAPEAVSQGEAEDDMWGVDHSMLVPMMIKEIQDLKARLAVLEAN